MIDRERLLTDLQKLLQKLEADLLERSESAEVPHVGQTLRDDYEQAKSAARTAQNYEDWRSDAITQTAAAWVLSCVFVRFLEDNRLIDPPKIAGPGERLRQARDEWELFLANTSQPNERDYLLGVFDALAKLPGTRDVFGPHNPLRELPNWLSGDAARDFLNFFQTVDADTGLLVHDFTDPEWGTRFLGDLYQDLSEAARKKYALLQTPDFVEAFILDRTLEPALDEFGLMPPPVIDKLDEVIAPAGFRMIDPACGSGHFLLGGFRRILDRWQRTEPDTKTRELVQRALDSVYGVDVNPFAVAIARFRLLLAAMRACGITRLANAPAFQLNLACGDSLLHGPGSKVQTTLGDIAEIHHAYQPEDLSLLQKFLTRGIYHAVIANPPYIVPNDNALNQAYRQRYSACSGQYSLSVPFMQRIVQLAVHGGFTGQITANSFARRDFGKKLIEVYLPTVDVTHVIDTSGATIPGHTTPTYIVFIRHRHPYQSTVRVLMKVGGDDSDPLDPSKGDTWLAILRQIDLLGSESDYLSCVEVPRDSLAKHPWNLGGGGQADLKTLLDDSASSVLAEYLEAFGRTSAAGEDEIWMVDSDTAERRGIGTHVKRFIVGECVRDWRLHGSTWVIYPYEDLGGCLINQDSYLVTHYLWPFRTTLRARSIFGKPIEVAAGAWYAHLEHYPTKIRSGPSIGIANIATHNHLVLSEEALLFNSTSPVMKFRQGCDIRKRNFIAGLMGSSAGCFWMKQVCFPKGTATKDIDKEGGRPEANRYSFSVNALKRFPIPDCKCTDRIARLVERIREEVNCLYDNDPEVIIEEWIKGGGELKDRIQHSHAATTASEFRLVLLQEELDWSVYEAFGLIAEQCVDPTYSSDQVSADDRPFMWLQGKPPNTLPAPVVGTYSRRRQVLEREDSIRLIEQPNYKRLWQGRRGVYGLAKSSYSDRWSMACRQLLLRILERVCTEVPLSGLFSLATLSDAARQNANFMHLGELYRDDPAFDVARLVAELVEAECVPLLPVLRYNEPGLRKRAEWEKTWDLQRRQDELAQQRLVADERIKQQRQRVRESFQSQFAAVEELAQQLRANCLAVRDRFAPSVTFDPGWDADMMVRWLGDRGIDVEGGLALQALHDNRERLNQASFELDSAVHAKCRTDEKYQAAVEAREAVPVDPEIDVPPKYASADFLKSDYWRLRGKLDVPKERWVSFPHCEGLDGTLMIAWAGYDHLQLARAVSAHYIDVQERLGGRDDPRLIPLLGCLIELLPWIKQWHNDPDAAFDGMRMGDYFDGFINEEARQLGKTLDEIKAWTPPTTTRGRGRKKDKSLKSL